VSVTRALAIAAFTAAVVAVGVLQWRASRPDSGVPTLGSICGVVLGYRVGRLPVGRIALLGFWWWIGWHFFAR